MAACGVCAAAGGTSDRFPPPRLGLQLVQPRSTEPFQVVLPLGVLLDRHLLSDPGKRNIGLYAAKLLECGRGDLGLTGHAGCCGEHSVGAYEIGALADTLARHP